jgi:hypothetical protein
MDAEFSMQARIQLGKTKHRKMREPRFLIQAHMLTKEEQADGEGARINKWLELADVALQEPDEEEVA